MPIFLAVLFDYPEIEALNQIYITHKVVTKTNRSQLLAGKAYYPLVHVTIAGQHFNVFVDDEYDDLRYNYPLLNLCLVLRELEGYALATEYEIWCQERLLDSANPQVKENHKHLATVYKAVTQLLGEVNSHVTDYDFELNAGAAQRLRRSK